MKASSAAGSTPGFLTRRLERLELPFRDFSPAQKRAVLGALEVAWQRLVDEEPELISRAGETGITARLQTILNDLREGQGTEVEGFSGSFFETVTREGAEFSYDGSSLEKQPDLTIRPMPLQPGLRGMQFRAFFIECKIVSRRRHPIRLYCQEGISRFVAGDYAWAMPSAVMLAYTRDGLTIENDLSPYLEKQQQAQNDPLATRARPTARPELSRNVPVHTSLHHRDWRYDEDRRPGPIEILHLWFPATDLLTS